VVVWADSLPFPHVLVPDEDSAYTVCLAEGCQSAVSFVEKAIAGSDHCRKWAVTDRTWQLFHLVFADAQVARARQDATPVSRC